MELARLQSLLYRLITAPSGVDEGIRAEKGFGEDDLNALIRSDDRLVAHERVEIYADAYFYRLLDVFAEDFPATRRVLGDTHFHNLITGYLIDYPPTEPSVMEAGRNLPDFIRTHPLADSFQFIGDLATLERALVEIFHAADASPLTAVELSAIPVEEWPALALRRHPASRLVQADWQVTEIMRAIERGESWESPSARTVNILVSRRGGKVFYRELEADEVAAMRLAENGATFAALCEVVAGETSEPDPAARIRTLLNGWLNEQVLVREPFSPSSPPRAV